MLATSSGQSFQSPFSSNPLTSDEAKYPFTTQRAETWIKAVSQAVQEWNSYLPLEITQQAEKADITVLRSPPPLQFPPPETNPSDSQPDRPRLAIGRARSAETRFEIYTKTTSSEEPPVLAHRFTIRLRPDQASSYLLAAARHELGHALGIWGHSPLQTDALYFFPGSQLSAHLQSGYQYAQTYL